MILKLLVSMLLLFSSLFAQSNPLPARASGQTAARTVAPSDHEVQVAMKNVMFHYSDPVSAHILHLQGQLRPTKPGTIVVFDDKNSFTLNLVSAEIAISCNSLARVLNENVFSSADAPIKNLSIESKNNQLIVKGKFHQKGDVPFETTGTLIANGDGRVRLHAEHVKTGHLPVKGLLDLLGIDLAGLINTNKVRGITVEKDDLILDPEKILPPPRIQGKVSAVRIQGDNIVQVFGDPQVPNFAAKQEGNYIAFHDGDMRFGKLTMSDSDLIMVDIDPRDSFDFYIDHYQDQLVAGYTKTTPEFGLRVHVVDYDKLRRHAAAR
jgi:hypothetical protein